LLHTDERIGARESINCKDHAISNCPGEREAGFEKSGDLIHREQTMMQGREFTAKMLMDRFRARQWQ
jgi:hypothetical protein